MNTNQKIGELERQLRAAKAARREAQKTPRDEPGGVLYFTIGSNIRAARLALGMTQSDLALQVQLKRTSIVNIENGRQRLPLTALYDIADALGVQATQLLPRNEDA